MPQAVSDREEAGVGSLDAASWQTRGKRDAGQKKQGFGGGAATGRTLERRVGKTRQKIAAPPPPMEVYDEQEGFRVYESEVGRLLVGAYLRCRGWRTRGFVGCGGRSKRGLRRQRKLLRRQRKSAERRRKLAERILVLNGISVRRVPDGRSNKTERKTKDAGKHYSAEDRESQALD